MNRLTHAARRAATAAPAAAHRIAAARLPLASARAPRAFGSRRWMSATAESAVEEPIHVTISPTPKAPVAQVVRSPRFFCFLECVTGIHAPWVVYAAPDAAQALLSQNSTVLRTAAPVVRVARVDAPALILCTSSSETL